jgi:hypothetical protein
MVTDMDLSHKVPAPATGSTPVIYFFHSQYRGAVDWYVNNTEHGSDPFNPNTIYKAVVTLTALDGYTFTGVAANSFTHSGATTTPTNTAGTNEVTVTISFPKTGAATAISDKDLTYKVPAPVKNGTPVVSFTSTQYKGAVAWSENSSGASHSGIFQPGTAYKAVVTLTAVTPYGLTDLAANSFTHNFAVPGNVTNTANSGTVTIIFPATAALIESGRSIKNTFGVMATGKDGVETAFTKLSDHIRTGGLTSNPDLVQVGDWIDLEDGLTVEAYEGKGDFAYTAEEVNVAMTVTYGETGAPDAMRGDPVGRLGRLIVVGINSFIGKNGNSTQHVVFQFQHVPVTRRMNATDTCEGGYEASEMRRYLTEVTGANGSGKFLAGLVAAGVPKAKLWAPKRVVSLKNGPGEISDLLWLPTEREINGTSYVSVSADETAGNQARLEYYDDNLKRRKYSKSSAGYPAITTSSGVDYWLASPYNGSAVRFCRIGGSGSYGSNLATGQLGCAPAFCIF